MEFGVLGPLRARRDEHDLPLGGPKQRALLAMLLLRANEVVFRDRLIEGIWGDRPPATAEHTLDNYVSRLRSALGEPRIERRPPGYLLRVEVGELDLDRFEQLLVHAREERACGRVEEAAAVLGDALALWRGAALADVLYEPFAMHEAERLEDLRLTALEERIDADLEVGRADEVIPELERLVRGNPFREQPLVLLMLALYRSGRQTDALAAFQSRRLQLSSELGLEPGPQLQELQRRILAHDESLDGSRAEKPMVRLRARSSVRRLAVAGVGAVVAASVAAGLIVGAGGGGASPALAGVVEIANAPAALVATGDSLWGAYPDGGTVARIEPASRSVVDQVPVGGTPGELAVGAGSVWAADVLGDHVTRIDPDTGVVTQSIPLGVPA